MSAEYLKDIESRGVHHPDAPNLYAFGWLSLIAALFIVIPIFAFWGFAIYGAYRYFAG